MSLPELFYGSIAVGPVIVALIAIFKKLGLPNDYALWANVILSLIFIGLIYATSIFPDIQQPIALALNFLVALLTAAGVYTVQKDVTQALRS